MPKLPAGFLEDVQADTSPGPTPRALKAVCVYCGSSFGRDPAFVEAAETLGKALAAAGLKLVYGGANIGLMGHLAHAVLDAGGSVIGVIPRFMRSVEKELKDASELVLVDSMHERKQIMFDRSQAFVALPGGVGTLEETVEMMTWGQLGRHDHPVVLANVNGFWDPLVTLLDHMNEARFLYQRPRPLYAVVDDPAEIVPHLQGRETGR